jgi:hypothetical protein
MHVARFEQPDDQPRHVRQPALAFIWCQLSQVLSPGTMELGVVQWFAFLTKALFCNSTLPGWTPCSTPHSFYCPVASDTAGERR